MQQPLISILVPAYNVGCYMEQCLNSIVSQTYRNLHVVIVDDGSTDDTGHICDNYASRYPYIEVCHIENSGVANARNILLSKIKGEYFLFVDSDDWIESDMVEHLAMLALRHNLDVVVCGSVIEDGKSHVKLSHDADPPKIWNREQCVEKFLFHKELNGSLWNKLILTSLFHNIAFNPEISYGEDALAIWHSLHRLNRMGFTRSTFYHYRMNGASISHQPFGEKKMSSHKVWNSFVEDTIRLYPKFSQLAKANYAVADFWLLYYAAMDSYAENDNIRQYRINLKKNLTAIYRYKLLAGLKYITAVAFVISYSLGGAMLRFIKS